MFEEIDGREPGQPWSAAELCRVVEALETMAGALTPSPVAAPADHPRLGGWAELAGDAGCVAKLTSLSPWATRHLDRLISLEQCGLADAAAGDSLRGGLAVTGGLPGKSRRQLLPVVIRAGTRP